MFLFLLFLAYIIGSFPTALVIGKGIFKKDIREFGSGNLGGTNAFRVLGWKAGVSVMIVDLLKGTLASSLSYFYGFGAYGLLFGLLSIIGHVYPVFAGFRGGKAVATSGGVILFYNPLLFLLMFICFLLVLFVSRYVSLASVITPIAGFTYTLTTEDVTLKLILFLMMVFIIFRHHSNLTRIKNKTEPKVSFKNKNRQ